MTPNDMPMHDALKVLSGFSPETPDDEVRDYWNNVFPTEIEKPCGVLAFCPYGPLVEQFPLDGQGGEDWTAIVEPEDCRVFGHSCPVFYVAEPLADPDAIAANCLCEDCRRKLEDGLDHLDQLLPQYERQAQELRSELRDRGHFTDDRYVTCRGCGFPAAFSQYQRSSQDVSESCPRCGFSCSYPLELEYPGYVERRNESSDLEDYLTSECVALNECAECAGTAYLLLNVFDTDFALVELCPTCGSVHRSGLHSLPESPRE